MHWNQSEDNWQDKSTGQVPFVETTSVEQLVQSLSAEADAAEARLQSIRSETTGIFDEQEPRPMRFEGVADRIHAIQLMHVPCRSTADDHKKVLPNSMVAVPTTRS
jgi:hypothetical protein